MTVHLINTVHLFRRHPAMVLWQRGTVVETMIVDWELLNYQFLDLTPAIVQWQNSLRSEPNHFSLRLPRASLPGAHLSMELAMLESAERRLLEAEYYALVQKLSDQGLEGPGYTEEEIKSLSLRELRQVVKTVLAIARTPGGR